MVKGSQDMEENAGCCLVLGSGFGLGRKGTSLREFFVDTHQTGGQRLGRVCSITSHPASQWLT